MARSVLWMLGEWTLRTTALAMVAGSLLLCFRIKDVSLRLAVWTTVLAGALLLPMASLVSPQVAIWVPLRSPVRSLNPNLAPARPESVIDQTTASRNANNPSTEKSGALAGPGGALRTLESDPRWLSLWPLVAVCGWLVVACALLLRLAIGLRLSRRLVKASRQVEAGVCESAAVTVPVTVGLIHPVILLPLDWRDWEVRKLEAVLAHERAHVQQNDPLRLLAASFYRALCWFHPLAWWLNAHLADLAERASDDAALAVIRDCNLYAETLFGFFQRTSRRVHWQGTAMARHRTATMRIERILDSDRELSHPLSRSVWLALILATVPLLYLAGSAQPMWAGGHESGLTEAQMEGKPAAASEFLFERRPLIFWCVDWKNGRPDLHTGGTRTGGVQNIVGPGNQAPYVLTRPEELSFSRAELPALTIAADPNNLIAIAGANRPDWRMRYCAQGSGQSEAEAREHLQQASMTRTGGAISLNAPDPRQGHPDNDSLLVDAPADAPLVIHGSFAATEVRDMAGPVRITATGARAKVLYTTGQVDATATVVDFAGSRGRVTLTADHEINLKMSAPQFDGTLMAWAQGDVKMLVPPGFITPFEVMVQQRKDFVCRAEFCSKVKEKKNGLYIFAYGGGSGMIAKPALQLRSERAAVVIDAAHGE